MIRNKSELIQQFKKLNKETIEHSKRVMLLSTNFCENKLHLTQKELSIIKTGSFFHDIGKSWIDSDILSKVGSLNDADYKEIKKHPSMGYIQIKKFIDDPYVLSIILEHHERIDGKGYPYNKKGKDLNYLTKIVSICDAYDSMITDRCYREAKNVKNAIEELINNEGTQFDSDLVFLFCQYIGETTYLSKKIAI